MFIKYSLLIQMCIYIHYIIQIIYYIYIHFKYIYNYYIQYIIYYRESIKLGRQSTLMNFRKTIDRMYHIL